MVHHFRSSTALNLQLHEKIEDVNVTSWRNLWLMQWNCFIRRLTVSCLANIFLCCISVGQNEIVESLYPQSAMIFSPGSRASMIAFRASLRFGHSPHGRPPWAQTMSPVRIQIPISFRKPGPLNLWDHHFGWNSDGSLIWKWVLSREINVEASLIGAFRNRSSQFNFFFEKI